MRQLIYVSHADLSAGDDIDFIAQQIVIQSMQANRLADITGFLVTGDGRFLQLLEGPSKAVNKTFTRISNDARHMNIVVISDTISDGRLFHDWSMAVAEASALPAFLDAGIAKQLLIAAAGARER